MVVPSAEVTVSVETEVVMVVASPGSGGARAVQPAGPVGLVNGSVEDFVEREDRAVEALQEAVQAALGPDAGHRLVGEEHGAVGDPAGRDLQPYGVAGGRAPVEAERAPDAEPGVVPRRRHRAVDLD